MTSIDLFDFLLQLEDEFDLFHRKVGGVHFWEWLRNPVYTKLREMTGIVGQAHTSLEHNFGDISKGLFLLLKNVFFRNPYFVSRSDFLFFGSPRRKWEQDRKWWDTYCDPVIAGLDANYIYFEPPYLNHHFIPAKTRNIRYLDLPLYFSTARYHLRVGRLTLARDERLLLKAIEDRVRGQCKVGFPLEAMVKRYMFTREATLPFYLRLIRRVRPKLVFVVCSHGKETFIEACKSLEVPVIELQHGVISRYHLGYSFPGPNRVKRTFPDYLFLFGDFWKEGIEYPVSKERVYSVGYPYLEEETKRYTDVKKKNQILFLSAGTIGRQLSEFAVQLAQRRDPSISIIYKLHPGEYDHWSDRYPWLMDAEVRVIDDDSIPLYQLLAESRVQVGVYSTAVCEGLKLGAKAILLDLPGIEHMERLINNNLAEVVSSVNETVEIMAQMGSRMIDTQHLFKNDSLNNIRDVIQKLSSD